MKLRLFVRPLEGAHEWWEFGIDAVTDDYVGSEWHGTVSGHRSRLVNCRIPREGCEHDPDIALMMFTAHDELVHTWVLDLFSEQGAPSHTHRDDDFLLHEWNLR